MSTNLVSAPGTDDPKAEIATSRTNRTRVFRDIVCKALKPDQVNFTEIEFTWFLHTRASALQALHDRAIQGSDVAAKIYFDRMDANQKEHEKLLSQPRDVSPNAASWIQQSVGKKAKKQAIESPASEQASGPDVSMSVSQDDGTPQQVDIDPDTVEP